MSPLTRLGFVPLIPAAFTSGGFTSSRPAGWGKEIPDVRLPMVTVRLSSTVYNFSLASLTTSPAELANAATARTTDSRFYHPELDALRFFAFLMVFLHHAFPHQPEFWTNSAYR